MPTTIVTGASRGIGAAICRHLSQKGHHVIGIARHRPTEFEGDFYVADLADEKQVIAIFSEIARHHQIDNLINNAGRSSRASLENVQLVDLHDMVALNVQATVQCTQQVLAQMRARKNGRIVNMASRALLGRERTSIYAATKAAVESLTRSWALELADCGITVNAVAPGIITSEMYVRNNPPGSDETARLLDRIPMHRPGEPREVAGAVAYFLSDDASYTTGQTLYVCGGWSV